MAENKYQERIQQQADDMRKAYAELRAVYDDPTDEQILGVAGNNLRGYQKSIGNKAGNWGTAFGSNALWGTLNKETRAALEREYQESQNANKTNFAQSMNQSVYDWGEGDNKRSITKGMQMDIRNWGDGIDEKKDLTPEQITALNTILTNNGLTNITIPTQQITSKDANGEDVVTETQLPMSYNDMLDNLYANMSDEEKEAFDYLGFVERDDDGNFMYVRPHNETFEEKLARREREQARIDLATQQRALERQRARAGLADLAAGIGDMIKASGGAIVTPRDYRAMYESLTAQQQTNYNNYLARMQALKEQEKEKRRLAEERAYQEKLLATQHERDMEKLLTTQEFQAGEAQKDRDWKSYEAELERALKAAGFKNEADIAAIKEGNKGISLSIGDKTFMFSSKDQHNSTVATLYGPILKAIAEKTDNGYRLREPYSTIINSLRGAGVDSVGQVNAVVLAALRSEEVLNNIELVKELQKVARDNGYELSGTNVAPVTPAAPVTPSTPTGGNAGGKRYKHKETGEEISEAQLNAKAPSDRNNYIEVQ